MPQPFSYHPSREVPGVRLDPADLTNPTSMAAGGFATIWRAGQQGQYAIKCFNAGGVAAAEEEFQTMHLLSGRRVAPQVFGLGTFIDGAEHGYAAIVEEYVDGYTLAHALKHGLLTGSVLRPVLDCATTVVIGTELARALVQLDQAGVSHRDLSANNVMLAKESVERGVLGGVRLTLIDFGQSTPVVRPSVTPSFRARLATIPYGAPEMYGGEHWEQRNSAKCDIWSFGALLVTMLVGEHWPSQIADLAMGISSPEDLERVCQAKREPLDLNDLIRRTGAEPSEAQRYVAKLVRRCTQYDPGMRPSAAEALAALERLGVAVTPRRPTERNSQAGRAVEATGASGQARPGSADNVRGGSPAQVPAARSGRHLAGRQAREGQRGAAPRQAQASGAAGQSPAVRSAQGAEEHPLAVQGARGYGQATKVVTPAGPVAQAAAKPDVAREGRTRLVQGPQRQTPPPQQQSPQQRSPQQRLPQQRPAQGQAVGAQHVRVPSAQGQLPGQQPVAQMSFRMQGATLVRYVGGEREVAIPQGVVVIGPRAFMGCADVERVLVPESVRSIGEYAFEGCTSLCGIALPAVARLGEGAFCRCSSLESVTVREPVDVLPNRLFAECASLARVRLPSTLRVIGEEAFYGCAALAHVDIPDGVGQVGSRAFCGCKRLAVIDVPASVTDVGKDAFVTGARGSMAVTSSNLRARRRVSLVVLIVIVVAVVAALVVFGGYGLAGGSSD